MKTLRALGALAPLAFAACGGVSPDAFEAAAPSYEALAIDLDAAASQSGMGGSMMPLTADSAVPAADFCHPHLFMRTEGLAGRLNRHLWKFLRLAEEVTARKADLVTGTRAVWEKTRGTFDIRFTVTRQTDVLYDWLLEVKPTSDATWTTVFSGWIDRTGATGKHQGKGHADLDLTALHAVVPMEPATGAIAADFETFDAYRKLVVTATQVAWDFGGEMGIPAALHLPRDSHYVYYRARGVGGSLKAVDDMAFACPPPAAGADPEPAHVLLVSRWYKAADGSVHGRSDAMMTGGLLVPPVASIVGVTCHQAALEGDRHDERFWLMKAEDASGATLLGWSPPGVGPDACDPALNPPDGFVPDLADATHDYVFPDEATMMSGDPAPFPGGP